MCRARGAGVRQRRGAGRGGERAGASSGLRRRSGRSAWSHPGLTRNSGPWCLTARMSLRRSARIPVGAVSGITCSMIVVAVCPRWPQIHRDHEMRVPWGLRLGLECRWWRAGSRTGPGSGPVDWRATRRTLRASRNGPVNLISLPRRRPPRIGARECPVSPVFSGLRDIHASPEPRLSQAPPLKVKPLPRRRDPGLALDQQTSHIEHNRTLSANGRVADITNRSPR
jgi:hypothetical protein